MRSEKRYNLERNRDFNSQRSQDDRRAYRALMRELSAEDRRLYLADREAWGEFLRRRDAYLSELQRHFNRAASFPSFAEWSARIPTRNCSPADGYAHCKYRETGSLSDCRDRGGCLNPTPA